MTVDPASAPVATRCHTVEVVLPGRGLPDLVQPAGAPAVTVLLATVVTRTRPSPADTAGGDRDRHAASRCPAPRWSRRSRSAVLFDPTWTVWVIVSDSPPASVTFSDTW